MSGFTRPAFHMLVPKFEFSRQFKFVCTSGTLKTETRLDFLSNDVMSLLSMKRQILSDLKNFYLTIISHPPALIFRNVHKFNNCCWHNNNNEVIGSICRPLRSTKFDLEFIVSEKISYM